MNEFKVQKYHYKYQEGEKVGVLNQSGWLGAPWEDKEEKLLTNDNKPMNLLQRIKNLALSEPQKSFKKYGITNEFGDLTSDGKEAFINWLFEQHQHEFKADVVNKLITEDEKENKKSKK